MHHKRILLWGVAIAVLAAVLILMLCRPAPEKAQAVTLHQLFAVVESVEIFWEGKTKILTGENMQKTVDLLLALHLIPWEGPKPTLKPGEYCSIRVNMGARSKSFSVEVKGQQEIRVYFEQKDTLYYTIAEQEEQALMRGLGAMFDVAG